MSSDLLQQAMIDAAALKEAAMKNAENALIEKYSHEFNQTVQKLLEQEEVVPAVDAASVAPPPAPSADASAAPNNPAAPAPDAATPDMSADPTAAAMSDMEKEEAFSKVPGSFSGDDDQLITINFDQIKATLNEMYAVGNKDFPDPKGGNPSLTIKLGEQNNAVVEEEAKLVVKVGSAKEEEGLELDEDLLGEFESEQQQEFEGLELEEIELEEADKQTVTTNPNIASKTAQVGKAKSDLARQEADLATLQAKQAEEDAKSGASSMNLEESVEFSEEELQELAEQLSVDIDPDNLSDGYMGSTVTQKREQRTLELAAARDEKATEEREAELEKMKDLMQENTQLKSLNNEALETINALKEQVEKLNVLNAKLLYTNKALANVSLNERQKSNIVESLSKADSVLAAKTIYDTVQNAVEGLNKEKEAPQSLRETLNRAATPFVVKKSANNSISDLMAERMKALAGIKKLS